MSRWRKLLAARNGGPIGVGCLACVGIAVPVVLFRLFISAPGRSAARIVACLSGSLSGLISLLFAATAYTFLSDPFEGPGIWITFAWHAAILEQGDPYYNPNLTHDREDYSIR